MDLLTTTEVAERLGIHITRVHQLIKDERLPAERKGRDWFIREEDLALVADRKPGRPKKVEEEGETSDLPAVTAAEMKAGDVVKAPAKSKTKTDSKNKSETKTAKKRATKKAGN